MDVRYIKEQHHNYMVIRSTEDETKVSYQKKMVSGKNMKRLIGAEDRIIDGSIYNYYDITSRISLTQLYGSRRMNIEDITELVHGLRDAFDEAERYLLDCSRIWMDPDHIFYNYTERKFAFVYNISAGIKEVSEGMGYLFDYLLEHVLGEDQLASDYVYKVYDLYEKDKVDIWEMAEILPKECEAENQTGKNPENRISMDSFSYKEKAMGTSGEPETVMQQPLQQTPEKSSMVTLTAEGREHSPVPIILTVLGIIGLIACILVAVLMDISEGMQTVLMASVGGALALLISGITLGVKTKISEKKRRTEEKELRSYINDEFAALDYEKVTNIHMADIMAPTGPAVREASAVNDGVADSDEGRTVFFEGNDSGYKLYALDRKNKQHILLDRFPYTIGKMTGYVDCCIDDPSISRLHARLESENGQISIHDLNSTNGVYLNGYRLGPNESRNLEVGDEIKLGGLTYCLRYC